MFPGFFFKYRMILLIFTGSVRVIEKLESHGIHEFCFSTRPGKSRNVIFVMESHVTSDTKRRDTEQLASRGDALKYYMHFDERQRLQKMLITP